MTPSGHITAVISDFGGVLTSPLADSFAAFEQSSGISGADLGAAMAAAHEQLGAHPLFELETGRLTELEFHAALGEQLTLSLGRPVEMTSFAELFLANLSANLPMVARMRELRAAGYRMAICTNNVREWSERWRAMLPVEEIFELVIDSSFVGFRKPEPEIYELTLAELGVTAAETLFIDDFEINCDGARALGMTAVHFRDTDQALAEIDAALAAA